MTVVNLNNAEDGPDEPGEARIEVLEGARLTASLRAIALLRIDVLREYPFLYDGDLEVERRYLEGYAASPSAVVVGAFDGDRLVGAATGGLMEAEAPAWTAPFKKMGVALHRVFYFGESVLRPSYRGRGLGRRFYELREAAAARQGARICAFATVIRPDDHPARPADYRPLDGFWRKRGYAPMPGAIAEIEWREIGETVETAHRLQYWAREI